MPCNVGKEQGLDTKIEFRREKWCGKKCSKQEVDSLNLYGVLAIQT